MAEETDSYIYYSDSPEILYSIDSWNKLNDSVGQKQVNLPEGWPKHLEGPHLWHGDDLDKHPERYRYYFTFEDLQEIERAVKNFENSKLPLSDINKETFKLNQLGNTLALFSEELYNGIGVRLLRGFNIDEYDERGRIIAYLGISSYIGDIRDAQGLNRALTHIKSIAHIPKDERAPIGLSQQTTDPQMYHSDLGGDIVSLFVLSTPKRGGESLISSSYSIYNHLAEFRPDIIHTLTQKNRFKRKDAPAGEPLIYYHDGQFISSFSTRNFIGFREIPRDDRFPPISNDERDALGAFNALAYKYTLSTDFQKGDIEYVNNLINQHSRKGFVEDNEHRRHVVRLWMRNSKHTNSLNLPPSILRKREEYFPQNYQQEIPLNELEEDEIKTKAGATSLEKIYEKPK